MVSLKMKAAGSSELLTSVYQITRPDVKKTVGQIVSLSAVKSSKLMCLNLVSVVCFVVVTKVQDWEL
jgi:hypothetical protein